MDSGDSLRVVLPAGEEVEVAERRLRQADIIRGVQDAIRTRAGDPGGPEAVVGDALGQGGGAEETGGLGGQRGDGAQAVGVQAAQLLPKAVYHLS